MKDTFNKLCTPAKIYFAIAVIMSILELFNGIDVLSISIKLLFAFIWTFILGWVCKKGYKSISWFLVVFPYIIILLGMFGIYKVTTESFGGFSKYFPKWGVGFPTNNKNNCIANCREETRKRDEELMQNFNNGMYSRSEMQKIRNENRQLQTNCYNNCDSSY
jgi:hypothetical protein